MFHCHVVWLHIAISIIYQTFFFDVILILSLLKISRFFAQSFQSQ